MKLHNRILLETVQSFPSGNYATIKCVLYGAKQDGVSYRQSQGERPRRSSPKNQIVKFNHRRHTTMKKVIALFLTLAMMVGVLAGCGGTTSNDASSTPDAAETTQQTQTEKALALINTFATGDTETAASLLAEGYIQHNLAYGTGGTPSSALWNISLPQMSRPRYRISGPLRTVTRFSCKRSTTSPGLVSRLLSTSSALMRMACCGALG